MIAIIDYDAGNLASVERAVRHIGRDCAVTADAAAIDAAERIIFPGVGAAGAAMESLRRRGLDAAIRRAVEEGRPVLGICLGTQIVMGSSEEDGGIDCLGLVAGEVRRFPAGMAGPGGAALKIPHMGWNKLRVRRAHPVLAGLSDEDEFYFVHSYYPAPADDQNVVCETDYGLAFASVVAVGSLVATQFHLEKSGRPGLRILTQFCEWTPC
ncbi:MAG: imidazole glycerol phosphate synthase subunit HisH [Desulfococcaceae bacterium]